MNWFWTAFLGMLCFAGMSLTFKKLSFALNTPVILLYAFSLNAVLYAIYSIQKGFLLRVDGKNAALVLLASIFAFIGNLCDLEALRLAPNAGYASAVKSGQIIVITLAAYFLFRGQTLTLNGLAGILLILSGLILLSTENH